MKSIRNVKVLRFFRVNGIVLWPFILYADRKPSECVMNHEAIHAEQIRETGVVAFYFRYLSEYVRGRFRGLAHDEAYRSISFEREAYQHQHDHSYVATRSAGRTSPRNNRSRERS